MTKIQIHPTIIVRIPKFSYKDNMQQQWNALKNTIKEASPEFYKILQPISFEELAKTSPKIRQTAQKYFNRCTFRSTPFGTMASVGTASISLNSPTCISIASSPTIHAFCNWPDRPVYDISLNDIQTKHLLIYANQTFYQVGKEIRYIRTIEGQFQIAVVEADPIILKILNCCLTPKTLNSLLQVAFLQQAEVSQYIIDLLSIGLLFTSMHPNIIGRDYFSRIGKIMDKQLPAYIISEACFAHSSIDKGTMRYLPEAIKLLQQINYRQENEDLIRFKENFLRKFEGAEVPIMVALDPEIGVGYGHLENRYDGQHLDPLIRKSSEVMPEANKELKNRLYKAILSKFANQSEIALNELVDGESEQAGLLPNSFSVVANLIDEDLHLEMVSGVTATAILGRFALAIDKIKDHCRHIARMEQQANPGALFFDVGYTKEENVDNVNRRPSIYNFELNILNYPSGTSQLLISDILVSIRQGEILLRSKSYNKRIVPRIASAYNHSRSDLPLFRFLADLQQQGLKTAILFRPYNLLPTLPYYPRIRHKNLIISPATWYINYDLVKDHEDKSRLTILQQYLRQNTNCPYVKVGSGDQTLCLNWQFDTDLQILLNLLEREKELYLEEARLPVIAAVHDYKNMPFVTQLIITLTHTQEIYKALSNAPSVLNEVTPKKWVPPGKEWLYFEIHCDPIRMDQLLMSKIDRFLKQNRRLLICWFFIRYTEHGDHIRLRLKLKKPEYGYKLMAMLSAELEEELSSGIVSDIRVRMYKKEVHRYSAQLMESVEMHFCLDSSYILNMLRSMLSDFAKYRLCCDLFQVIAESAIMDEPTFRSFTHQMADSFNREHKIDIKGFKEINKLFKQLNAEPLPSLSKKALKEMERFKRSLIDLIGRSEKEHKAKLLGDLLHMHINRLFSTRQRTHEMLIYNFYLILSTKTKYISQVHALNA